MIVSRSGVNVIDWENQSKTNKIHSSITIARGNFNNTNND